MVRGGNPRPSRFHLDAFIGLLSTPDFTDSGPQAHLTIRHREKKDPQEPLTMKQP